MKKVLSIIMGVAVLAWATNSCDDAGCTLYNSTLCHIVFYDTDGNIYSLTDTLTVHAVGTDNLVYNRGKNLNTIQVQLSYDKDIDTLLYEHWLEEDDTHRMDTIYIQKTNTPHFESPDCGTSMFHDITKVWYGNDDRFPNDPFFGKVTVVHPQVYYNSSDNIHITVE